MLSGWPHSCTTVAGPAFGSQQWPTICRQLRQGRLTFPGAGPRRDFDVNLALLWDSRQTREVLPREDRMARRGPMRRLRLRGGTFCVLILSLPRSHCLRFHHSGRQSWGLSTVQHTIGQHRRDCSRGSWYWRFGGRGRDGRGYNWKVLCLACNEFVEELSRGLRLVRLPRRTRLFLQSICERRRRMSNPWWRGRVRIWHGRKRVLEY